MSAGQYPMNVVEIAQRQAAQWGRPGATRIVAAPALAAPIAIGPGTLGGPVTIKFKRPGTVIAMYGQELRGTAAAYATTFVRVLIGGSEDLFTDGAGGVYVPFLALFGQTNNWFPLTRRGTPGVDWSIFYRNDDAAATCTPFFGLAFIEDDAAPTGTVKR